MPKRFKLRTTQVLYMGFINYKNGYHTSFVGSSSGCSCEIAGLTPAVSEVASGAGASLMLLLRASLMSFSAQIMKI
jgi:hypothetical protein